MLLARKPLQPEDIRVSIVAPSMASQSLGGWESVLARLVALMQDGETEVTRDD